MAIAQTATDLAALLEQAVASVAALVVDVWPALTIAIACGLVFVARRRFVPVLALFAAGALAWRFELWAGLMQSLSTTLVALLVACVLALPLLALTLLAPRTSYAVHRHGVAPVLLAAIVLVLLSARIAAPVGGLVASTGAAMAPLLSAFMAYFVASGAVPYLRTMRAGGGHYGHALRDVTLPLALRALLPMLARGACLAWPAVLIGEVVIDRGLGGLLRAAIETGESFADVMEKPTPLTVLALAVAWSTVVPWPARPALLSADASSRHA